jgi:hypothetical protein
MIRGDAFAWLLTLSFSPALLAAMIGMQRLEDRLVPAGEH